MNLVAALKSGLDVHKDQAFQLNYAIANDPELSGKNFTPVSAMLMLAGL